MDHPSKLKTSGSNNNPTLPVPGEFQQDPLTGFYDHYYLHERLNQCILNPTKESASLALLQLRNFYQFRHWLGKSEATLLLSDIAKILKKALPVSVVLCRCQHYEFAVLITGQQSNNIKDITKQICRAVKSVAGKSLAGKISLDIGIGITHLDKRTLNSDVMLARARHNMNTLKNSTQLDQQSQTTTGNHELFARLKHCLKSNQLDLSFQAVVDLKASEYEHYELRVTAKDNIGSIPSSVLFEVAVQNAWGEVIDRWLIKQAINLLSQTSARLRLTLSLTHNSIVSNGFFQWLQRYINESGVQCSRLIFQISEIDVLIAQHHMGFVCQQLTKLDIALCINHFGCTDDPFRYLSLLRADFVKLDGALTDKYQLQNTGPSSLANLVDKLHDNGLRVVIGNVEQMSVLPTLWRCNINYVQGFCFHRPSRRFNFEFTPETALTMH